MIKNYIKITPSGTDGDSAWNPDQVLSMKCVEGLYDCFYLSVSYALADEFNAQTNPQNLMVDMGLAPNTAVEIRVRSYQIDDESLNFDALSYASVVSNDIKRERLFYGYIDEFNLKYPRDNSDALPFVELKINSFLHTLKKCEAYSSYRDHLVSELFSKSFEVAAVDSHIEFSSLMEIEMGDGPAKIQEVKADTQSKISEINGNILSKKEEIKECKEKIANLPGNEDTAPTSSDVAIAEKIDSPESTSAEDGSSDNQKSTADSTPQGPSKELAEISQNISTTFDEYKTFHQDPSSDNSFDKNRSAASLQVLSQSASDKINEVISSTFSKNTEVASSVLNDLKKYRDNIATKAREVRSESQRDVVDLDALQVLVNEVVSNIESASPNADKVFAALGKESQESEENAFKNEFGDVAETPESKALKEQHSQLNKDLRQLESQRDALTDNYLPRVPKDYPFFRYSEFVIPGIPLWDVGLFLCADTKSIFISDWHKAKESESPKENVVLMQGGYSQYPFYGMVFNFGELSENDEFFQVESQGFSSRTRRFTSFFEDEVSRTPIDIELGADESTGEQQANSDGVSTTSKEASRTSVKSIENTYSHQENLAQPSIPKLSVLRGWVRRCDLFPGVKIGISDNQSGVTTFYIVSSVEHQYHNDGDYTYDYLAYVVLSPANDTLPDDPDQVVPVVFDKNYLFDRFIEMSVVNPSKQINSFGDLIEQDKSKTNRTLLVHPHVYNIISNDGDKLPGVVENYAVWVRQMQSMAGPSVGFKTLAATGGRAVVGFKNSKPYLPVIFGYNYTPSYLSETSDKSSVVDDSVFSWYVGQAYISMGVSPSSNDDE